jgi:protoheme IX farnesyltransferase
MFDWIRDRCVLIKTPIAFMSAAAALFGYAAQSRTPSVSAFVVAVSVFCLSGGASALNSYQDRLLDGLMERTRIRPVPTGRISPFEALLVSAIMIAAGTAGIVLAASSVISPLAGLFAIILYNALYTPLKRRTQLALVPGVLCGMMPPLVGWLAAGGSAGEPLIWYIMIFFGTWQVPHFWLIFSSFGKDFRLSQVPNILDSISQNQLDRLILIWSVAYCILLLFMRPLYIIRYDAFAVVLLLNALAVPLVFLIILHTIKSNKKYRYLFHYLNITTLAVIGMAVVDTAVAASGTLL